MGHNKEVPRFERYDLERSPFAQQPTQKEVAKLVGESRDDLRRLVNYKEQFIVRRTENVRGKIRELAYPVARFRAVHERLKFHFDKVKQRSYLFSPRKRYSQRDNAALHLDRDQYLTLDLRQFYPSTTASMVRRWFIHNLNMYEDVAGLLTHLCTIDGKVSFGSPLTPVLCTLVHREMFDAIADVCDRRHLRISVWVDDLTISGKFVPGAVVNEIREIVRVAGLKSHKIRYRSGNRPVFITGIGVVGKYLVAPNTLNLRIKNYWDNFYAAQTIEEKATCIERLLSQLGTVRHISGRSSVAGRKAADQMNFLRQKRVQMVSRDSVNRPLVHTISTLSIGHSGLDSPF